MKLDKLNKRDYPKLQAERILKTNKTASLHALPTQYTGLRPTLKRDVAGGKGYVPRVRGENEALPRTGDWRSSMYDPKEPQSKVGLARFT